MKNTSNPLISVILPVYNAQDHLNETLEALSGQTLRNIEFICVDDGSTDDSGRIIDHWAECDDRFVPVHTANQGVYKARETGMAFARGGYVGFCDADDSPLPTMYEEMALRAAQDDPGMVVCAFRRVSSSGETLSTEMRGFSAETLAVRPQSGWLPTINTSLWNKIIRRDVLDSHIRLENPPRVMEDAMLLVSLFPKTGSIAFVDEPLYCYRAPEQSAMSSVGADEVPHLIESWQLLRDHVLSDNPNFAPVVDLAAFIHLRISAPTRMSRNARRDTVPTIDAALREHFPLWRRSPFMSCAYVRQNRRLLTTYVAYLCYRARLLGAALWAYDRLTRLTGLEVKW